MTKIKSFFAFSVVVLSTLACNALFPSVPSVPSVPVTTARPLSPDEMSTLSAPLTEANLRRVTIQDAKAAFDDQAAIFVDVRSENAFAVSHIPGAINIQLGEFETNPTELNLPKDHWIITYCT